MTSEASATGPDRRAVPALAAALAAGLVLWVLVGPLTKVPLWGDEGQHLNGAQNLLVSQDRWLQPMFDPQPGSNAATWDTHNVSFPPTLISLYALALDACGGGSLAFGLPLLLAHLIAGAGVFHLTRRLYGRGTAWIALLLWLWSPAGFRRGTQIMAEPFLVCVGMLALALTAEAAERRSRWCSLAAGACLGLGFLFKLWLVGPFVLMAAGIVIAGFAGQPWRERLRHLAAMVLGAATIAGVHLAALAVVCPSLLRTWLAIYFDLIIDRIDPGQDAIVASGPVWQYVFVLYRDHWPMAIPLAAAAWELVRGGAPCWRARAARALAVGSLASVLVLSLYGSKTPLYVYFVAPLAAIAAARGVTLTAEADEQRLKRLRPWLGAAAASLLVAGFLLWIARTQDVWPDVVTLPFSFAHTAAVVWSLVLVACIARWQARPRTIGLLILPVLAGLVTGIEQVQVHRDEACRPVADYVAAYGRADTRSQVCFVSPDWHVLGFFLWQQGRPWAALDLVRDEHEVLERLAAGDFDFVHIDKQYRPRPGGLPDRDSHDRILSLLSDRASDVTAEIERAVGRPLSTFVFVPKNYTGSGRGRE